MEAWILRKTVDELLRVRLVMRLGTSLRESTNWIYGDFSFSEDNIWNNCDTRCILNNSVTRGSLWDYPSSDSDSTRAMIDGDWRR